MPNCRKCNQPIEFKPHPKNPNSMAPFDVDGEIHFARCKSKPQKPEFDSIAEMGDCYLCNVPYSRLYWKTLANGNTGIFASCKKFHARQVAKTEKHAALVNTDHLAVFSYYRSRGWPQHVYEPKEGQGFWITPPAGYKHTPPLTKDVFEVFRP